MRTDVTRAQQLTTESPCSCIKLGSHESGTLLEQKKKLKIFTITVIFPIFEKFKLLISPKSFMEQHKNSY